MKHSSLYSSFTSKWLIAFVIVLFPATIYAQLKPSDYTKRNGKIQHFKFSGSKSYSTKKYTDASFLDKQRLSFNKSSDSGKLINQKSFKGTGHKMFSKNKHTKEYKFKDKKDYLDNQKIAGITKNGENITLDEKASVTKNPVLVKMDQLAAKYDIGTGTMSLRDVNRYQRPQGYSDEPGIPVQKAGDSEKQE